jgi:hypothetical protein
VQNLKTERAHFPETLVSTNSTPLCHIPEHFTFDIGHCDNLKSQKSLLFRIFGERQNCDYIGKAYDAEPNPLPCAKVDITKRLALSDAPYNCISQIFQNVSRQKERENIEFIGTANCLSTIRNFFFSHTRFDVYTCVPLVVLVSYVGITCLWQITANQQKNSTEEIQK